MRRYRRPNMQPRRIKNAENYQNSNQRIQDLQWAIDMGSKAATVMDFVEHFIDNEEDILLKKIAQENSNLTALAADYRAALRFKSQMKAAVNEGLRKEQALNDLLEARRNN